jgi:hypothetical protein
VAAVVTVDTLRRLARRAWIDVGKAKNPWFEAAASEFGVGAGAHSVRWENWNRRQMELTRGLHQVVFHDGEPTDELLAKALDFLDGR